MLRCNHCTNAPCVAICPTKALFKREDGIVDFNTELCIGCKSCMQACPYDALYIDPHDHTAQKCNYCAHRTDIGLQPACVVVCPEQAIIAGDLDDPATRIARLVASERMTVRAPEQGTGPNVFYKGVNPANLDIAQAGALADSGLWRDAPNMGNSWLSVDLTPKPAGEIGNLGRETPSPSLPVATQSEAQPPRVVYNTDHPMPWGWKVSAYFLTKGIAAGIAMVAALALALGLETETAWLRWQAPLIAGVFLLLTGVFLVWDLKRPDRFLFLLTKGNPGSWLVRGAWILGAFAALLGIWFLTGALGNGPPDLLIWASAGLGLAVAGYTAYLFGQAEGRDLWQTRLLLWHMVGAGMAVGGGATLIAGLATAVPVEPATWVMLTGSGLVGVITGLELRASHPTANATAAMHHMIKGAYARQWWTGQLLLIVIPLAAAVLGLGFEAPAGVLVFGGSSAMVGVFLADDAFVRAGQSVPLS